MAPKAKINQCIGVGQALIPTFPVPFVAQRAPVNGVDIDFPLGMQWIDNSVSPAVVYTFVDSSSGTWETGGNAHASTTEFGTVILNDSITMAGATNDQVPTALAIKTYVDNSFSAGAPVATEVTAGIGQLATDAEAVAGTASTPALALFVTPSNLAAVFAAPPAQGGTTPAAGTFTNLTADGTGTVSLGANAASNFTVTGAFDLTLATTLGSLVVNAGEAAADAIDLNAASGGFDVDVALLASITSTRNNAQAILLESTAGGIDILASGSGGAGEDIDIVCTGGSVNVSGTENAADAVTISAANGGIDITCGGAAGEDIDLVNTAGSIHLNAGEAVSDAVNIDSSGGFDLDAVGEINLTSTQAAATAISLVTSDAAGGLTMTLGTGGLLPTTTGPITLVSTYNNANNMYLHANGGTSEVIKIHSDQGTGVASINVLSDVGGITLRSGLGSADAINIEANGNAAGGLDIDAGTAGVIVDTTGAISLDAAANSNLTTTGAFSMTVNSTLGQLALTSGQVAVDAVRVNASNAAGGIDVDAGTGGITIDTTGAFSIDGAAASNVTTTGAGIDLTLSSVLGSVLVESTEDAALAIRLHANGGTSETIQIHSDQGTGVASVGLLSDAGGITIRATGLASADAINLEAPAGGLDVDVALQMNLTSSQDASDAVRILASAGGIDIDAVGAAGQDINVLNTGGSVYIGATESAVDSVVLESTAGGLQILASGAAAGEDILVTATGSSVKVTSTEAAADAIVLTASDAAGGIDITTGGGSVDISSAGFATVVAATDTQGSPSATAVINANVGRATFTGFTTASTASQVFVITNSIVTTSSCVLVTVCNEGANDAQMTVQRVTRGAGSLSVTCKNNGAAALNGNVAVNFWVLTA